MKQLTELTREQLEDIVGRIRDILWRNADSRLMPAGVRWVRRHPVNRAGSSLPDAA
jgi:hypothetical protein